MIKKILISQPQPTGKNPYSELVDNYNIQVDFKKFFDIEPINTKEFKNQKINIEDYSGIIFTSRTAIDHFFGLMEQLKINVPNTMKYFCANEKIALYLQKYIVYRKRKIFFGENNTNDSLIETIEKYKNEPMLLPGPEGSKSTLYNKLKKNKFNVTAIGIYKIVSSDLKDIDIDSYDMVVFFSPWGVKALLDNFPQFNNETALIASVGNETAKAIKKAGLNIDIKLNPKKHSSMQAAIIDYIESNMKATKNA